MDERATRAAAQILCILQTMGLESGHYACVTVSTIAAIAGTRRWRAA
jgi:hypothetical protein